ncbi:MAG: E3 ubiquitin ligase family protein [Candidatus Schekmanbacteria bacterium]|nr:E3 ubiquitin ligase family protein [Candidatus Schekmanbacteria bacterium]
MWIAGLVFLLAGAGLGIAFFTQKSKLGLMEGTETSTAAELQQMAASVGSEIGKGAFSQMTEIKGTVVCDAPLTSELAQVPCVHYENRVIREYDETYWDTDANGNRMQRTRRGSDTVAHNARHVFFAVDDGTGRITVDAAGAKLVTEKALSTFEPGEAHGGVLRLGSFSLSLGGLSFGSGRRTLGYRYEEDVIPVGRPVYVLGEATDRNGSLRICRPADSGKMIVSVKSEEELVRGAQRTMTWLMISAIASAALGAVLLVVGLLT